MAADAVQHHAHARSAHAPSFALLLPRDEEMLRKVGQPTLPAPVTVRWEELGGRGSGVGGGGWVVWLDIACDEAQGEPSVFGMGEHCGGIRLNGRKVVTWNTDAFAYGVDSTPLYQSHPWVLVVLPDGTSFGVIVDTTYRCEADFTNARSLSFASPTTPSPPDCISLGAFASPTPIVQLLHALTGPPPLPPLWALGYQQCRYTYEPAARVLEVARKFRELDVPCDVVWLDIDYMDGYRVFTFDTGKYFCAGLGPQELQSELHAMGFRGVWMLDPGVKVDNEGYEAFASGNRVALKGSNGEESEGVWVRTANGQVFHGNVWPGPCAFPDFTNRAARAWWVDQVGRFIAHTNCDGVWNDMNEPALLNPAAPTMPESNVHLADAELGGTDTHARYHNAYGMLMVRSTVEAMRGAFGERRRPFVLSRANFLGGQRFAAAWSGDNSSTWAHLGASVPMVLSLAMSAQPFSGPDIGGFAGEATPRLFARWMGIGAMLPFARGHTEKGTRPHEPWAFGEACLAICRAAIKRRYRLLPHLYTAFFRCHRDGLPLTAPLLFAEPDNAALHSVDDAFLMAGLMVSCDHTPPDGGAQRPDHAKLMRAGDGAGGGGVGGWKEFDFGDPHPELPRLYVAPGSIVVVAANDAHNAPSVDYAALLMLVSLDSEGKATGQCYEDAHDGLGFAKGEFLLTTFEAATDPATNRVAVRVACREGKSGDFVPATRAWTVRLLLGGGASVEAVVPSIAAGNAVDGAELTSLALPDAPTIARSRDAFAAARERSDARWRSEQLPNMQAAELAQNHEHVLETDGVRVGVQLGKGGCLSLRARKVEWIERGGYEEYATAKYRGAGFNESFQVDEASDARVLLSARLGDAASGLELRREVECVKGGTDAVRIRSCLLQPSSPHAPGQPPRPPSCLRVHPLFTVPPGGASVVRFVSVAGSAHRLEVGVGAGEAAFEGADRPNGEWVLEHAAARLTNTFALSEVRKCSLWWDGSKVSLELWSAERDVSPGAPLVIEHWYRVEGRKRARGGEFV